MAQLEQLQQNLRAATRRFDEARGLQRCARARGDDATVEDLRREMSSICAAQVAASDALRDYLDKRRAA